MVGKTLGKSLTAQHKKEAGYNMKHWIPGSSHSMKHELRRKWAVAPKGKHSVPFSSTLWNYILINQQPGCQNLKTKAQSQAVWDEKRERGDPWQSWDSRVNNTSFTFRNYQDNRTKKKKKNTRGWNIKTINLTLGPIRANIFKEICGPPWLEFFLFTLYVWGVRVNTLLKSNLMRQSQFRAKVITTRWKNIFILGSRRWSVHDAVLLSINLVTHTRYDCIETAVSGWDDDMKTWL